MKKVIIYTDGGASPNPGPGGWGALLRFGDNLKELNGGAAYTTNNQMELTAAIRALEALNEPCEVELYTDSQYLKNGITDWIKGWKRNGWLTAAKKPVLNRDLWQRLDQLTAQHQVRWRWTRGHSGNPSNELVDALATAGRLQTQRSR